MRIAKPKERWFPCDGDPDGGKVLIRHLPPGERQDIFDETMPQKIEYEKDDDGNLEPKFSVEQDRTADRELTLKACIVNWEKFYEEDGKTLMECNEKNITRASREIEGFNEFITGCRSELEKDINAEIKDQEKN